MPEAEQRARLTRKAYRWKHLANLPGSPTDVDPTTVRRRAYDWLASRYTADVLAGHIPACKWVRLACQRQVRDLAKKGWAYRWDPKAAAKACHFLEQLPHVEGTWATPTIRLEPPQIFLVCCLFGWRRRDEPRRRRFTTLYWEVGRKAAKSTLMAGLLLYHVLEEDEPGAQGVCAATTGSQARIVFAIAQQMIARAPWLRARGLRSFANAICLMPDKTTTIASIKPINAKASTQDGLNPSCIVLDESHAQTFELHDVLKSAQGARHNPLLLCPTTAGYDQLSIGYALRTTLTKVLEGTFEADHLLGAIYTLDDGDDWRDESVWIKANPMLGVTPNREYLQRYCLDAQQTPGLEGEFKVKCCSLWSNAAAAWLSMAVWDACADPTLTLEQFTGDRCWMGIDLAERDDLAAVAFVFPRADQLVGFVRCYLPKDVVQERARAIPEYRLWAERGLLTMTDGARTDPDVIADDLRRWCQAFRVQALVFDDYDPPQLIDRLSAEGLPAVKERKTARTMTLPARELESRLAARRFRHDGNTCLKWQASNVVIQTFADGSILPRKESHSSPYKIDAIDALLQAIGSYVRMQSAIPNYAVRVVG